MITCPTYNSYIRRFCDSLDNVDFVHSGQLSSTSWSPHFPGKEGDHLNHASSKLSLLTVQKLWSPALHITAMQEVVLVKIILVLPALFSSEPTLPDILDTTFLRGDNVDHALSQFSVLTGQSPWSPISVLIKHLGVNWQNFLIIPTVFISSLAGAVELLMKSLSDSISHINLYSWSWLTVSFPESLSY